MAKSKYYAVKNGRESGIFETWVECEAQVKGFPGAKYKGFPDMESALKYMEESNDTEDTEKDINAITNEAIKETIENLDEGEVIAFVDGSYNSQANKIGYGAIIIDNNRIETQLYKAISGQLDSDVVSMRNHAAELMGAMEVINWAVQYKKNKITIYHDYEGVGNFATGDWKAKNPLSKEYVSFFNGKRNLIDINYIKVPAHSGIEYNEKADSLAAQSILEKGYKTYDDGSIYFYGYSTEDWQAVVNLIEEENATLFDNESKEISFVQNTISDGRERIEIKYGNHKVVINCYKNLNSYVQGKQSPLLEKVISLACTLKNDEKVVETLNKYHVLSIKKQDVEIEFEKFLPDFNENREGKHYNNLLSAVYNTRITGYMPDYTCLVTPVFRGFERYLHIILGTKMGLSTSNQSGGNNFRYFNKNTSGLYECTSSAKNVLNAQQLAYLNNLYTKYHEVRHKYSHWSEYDYDSAVIPDLLTAHGIIEDGLTLINNYYKIF